MKDRNIGAGPFTAGKCKCSAVDGAAVFDVTGETFCFVADDNCHGGNSAARARATRIAEVLNKVEGHVEE